MRVGTRTLLWVAIGLAVTVPFCVLLGPVIVTYLLVQGSLEQNAAAERSELTKMIFLTDDIFARAPEALQVLGTR